MPVPEPDGVEVIVGIVALTVVLGRPQALQQVEHGVTAGPLKLRIEEDAVTVTIA